MSVSKALTVTWLPSSRMTRILGLQIFNNDRAFRRNSSLSVHFFPAFYKSRTITLPLSILAIKVWISSMLSYSTAGYKGTGANCY